MEKKGTPRLDTENKVAALDVKGNLINFLWEGGKGGFMSLVVSKTGQA